MTDLYFFVFRIMSIGVVDILDVDVFGSATDAIVCLDVNACCINVVVGIKGDPCELLSWVSVRRPSVR